MFGKNPKRPPETGDGTTLQIQEIFPTLQGEGPYAGHPAIFIRLGGCNLACDFCDTEFESFSPVALEEVVCQVQAHATAGQSLVVITGGEPLRQNIAPLCAALIDKDFTVQIETNGTLWRDLPDAVEVVCSPKNPSGTGYAPLRPDVLARAQALKFIISSTLAGYMQVGDVGQSAHAIPVYVQPMDEYDAGKNAANQAYAAKLAQRHGYRLSLQLHKIIGVP